MTTADDRSPARRAVVVHVLDRFDIGGMERVALAVMARTRDVYTHRIVCLRDRGALAPDAEALGVSVDAIGKRPGKDWAAYWRLVRVLRAARPDIVHTYNIGALDVAFWARLAGVRHIVHAEHGRDVSDPTGVNRKYRWMRRVLAPAIDRFVAVSQDLERWLVDDVGVGSQRTVLIRNGIDTQRFAPAHGSPGASAEALGLPACDRLVGSVGRLDPVKDFETLIDAFARLKRSYPGLSVGLVLVGDGPEKNRLEALVAEHGLADRVRLVGARDDIHVILHALDAYVCSSIAEGVALTILEAMATGLPVIATDVGGNPELVIDAETGVLVPACQPEAIADAIVRLMQDPSRAQAMGRAGRERVEAAFSVATMTDAYGRLYDQLLES